MTDTYGKLFKRVSPRYPARNPARASRPGSVKAGWIVANAVDGTAVVIGRLPAGLEPGRAGPVPVPAVNGTQRKPAQMVTPRHNQLEARAKPVPRETFHFEHYGAA